MIVIADSGSTKADWKLIDAEQTSSVSTMGFNPVFHDDQLIYNELQQTFTEPATLNATQEVYYYGSGCWDAGRKSIIANALGRLFKNARIIVEHDLLAAARATCGTQPGIACIMGTGSNSCLYDGHTVIDNVTNIGFLLGDEGSGTHLGKQLLQAYFYREMPKELIKALEEWYPEGPAGILDKIYGKETPNVYLASFTRFLSEHHDHFFVKQLLYKCFSEFIDRHVRKYPGCNQIPVHFIGSVAYYFQDILKFVLQERNLQSGNFIRKPIDYLVQFHTTLVN
ncbi:MAG: hypothetical protein MRY78_19730 [Saprospiraceae bacterium]|nr:hypothetical protein [Saprospiraceae bacterium]